MLKKLFQKLICREVLVYLLFGILATVVDYGAYFYLYHLMGEGSAPLANALAFVVAVLFAFFTNKGFVFASKNWAFSVVALELATFIGARMFSFGIEELGILAGQHLLHLEDWSLFGIDGILLIKLPLSVITVVLNYLFSKFLVFRKKRKENP